MFAIFFLLANAIFIGVCIYGLRVARRRLKPRRVAMIVAISLLLTSLVSLLIARMSEVQPPGEPPDMSGEP